MGRRAYLSRHRIDLAAAGLLTLVLFAAATYRHETFRSYAYDLGVYQQVLWKMANGRGATSSLTAWNTFGDHFSPVLLAFVPLYKLAATPLWLFGIQSLAIGIGALCVRPLATAVGLAEDSVYPKLLLAAYVFNPALWNAALYDFHQTTVAVPVLMLGCIAALRQRHLHLWFVFLGLIVLRDDLALAALPLALIGWRSDDSAGRRQRMLLIGAGLAWTVIGSEIGTALGATRHFEERYGYLGSSFTDMALHPVSAGLAALGQLFSSNSVLPVFAMLLPLAFLPLRKPGWFLLGVSMMLPTLLATDDNFQSTVFHYGAPVVPFMFLAAAGGMRNPFKIPRAAQVGMGLGVAGFVAIGPLTTGALAEETVDRSDAKRAMAAVKASDDIAADNFMTPHLANRDVIKPFPAPLLKIDPTFPLDPRVIDTSEKSKRAIDAIVIAAPEAVGRNESLEKLLRDETFLEEFERQDYGTVIVFRRVAP